MFLYFPEQIDWQCLLFTHSAHSHLNTGGGGGSGEYEAAVNSISVSVGDKRLKIFMHILHSVRSLSGQKHRIEQVEREPFTSE